MLLIKGLVDEELSFLTEKKWEMRMCLIGLSFSHAWSE